MECNFIILDSAKHSGLAVLIEAIFSKRKGHSYVLLVGGVLELFTFGGV